MSALRRFAFFIGRLGPKPEFITDMAHIFFAAFVVLFVLRTGAPYVPVIGGAAALAAVKEFWFDIEYETPRQTYLDGLVDFVGYAIGIAIGFVASLLLR